MNVRDEYGDAPLHHASLKGDLDMVRFLIENGADVNTEDKNGKTPLCYARNEDAAQFLKENGARSAW